MAFLEVHNLVKDFGGLRANNDISFSVERGELIGLIGPNGAGKTTLFNCISGLHTLTSGGIIFDGEDITALKAHEVARRGLARTFQVYVAAGDLTVLENGNNNIVNPPVIIRNYPNPFSLGTWFEIQDETTRGTGTIEIYNIKGQKLKTLDLERDGEYWDGTDSQGKKVSVGIYLYRLKGGSSGNGNGKMLMIK